VVYGLCVVFHSMKTTLPSQNLIGFASPVSTSVGDRESYHGNLIVSPGESLLQCTAEIVKMIAYVVMA